MKPATATPLIPWAVLIHEYYGVFLTPGRADMWRSELSLRENCGPHTTDSEIEAAVRFGLSKDFKAGQHGFLKDLVMLVRWYRKEQRLSRQAGGNEQACPHCKDGWVTYWRALPENPGLDDYYGSEPCAVPCLCGRGQHWMATCKDYKDLPEAQRAELEIMARRGQVQEAERRRAVEKASKEGTNGL